MDPVNSFGSCSFTRIWLITLDPDGFATLIFTVCLGVDIEHHDGLLPAISLCSVCLDVDIEHNDGFLPAISLCSVCLGVDIEHTDGLLCVLSLCSGYS